MIPEGSSWSTHSPAAPHLPQATAKPMLRPAHSNWRRTPWAFGRGTERRPTEPEERDDRVNSMPAVIALHDRHRRVLFNGPRALR